jgi:hypothetical protein
VLLAVDDALGEDELVVGEPKVLVFEVMTVPAEVPNGVLAGAHCSDRCKQDTMQGAHLRYCSELRR